jgi:hypothetical protein
MRWQVLIAHAEGEENLAEELATPLREFGYEVAHSGTVMVGESLVAEASRVLAGGGPVILCATAKACGTQWANRVVNAARQYDSVRVFVVQMEKDVYLQALSYDDRVASYWQDPHRALDELLMSLENHYPTKSYSTRSVGIEATSREAEDKYRELALESCDIIDLANLPETDRRFATRQLELRRLYVPLRVQVRAGFEADDEGEDVRPTQVFGHGTRRFDWAEVPDRTSVGERLSQSRRLVVLAEPGGGKSTMIRWIATAYLLRLREDPDWKDLPDVSTLPEEDWLPIVIRCRDLDPKSIRGSLDDVLRHTLRKSEMSEEEAEELRILCRLRLEEGQAILLVDGLDEITNPRDRIKFCRQIEQISRAYQRAPIIATSRTVDYREMGHVIGAGFEHIYVDEFTAEDKDDFARRWCSLTELPDRRDVAAEELARAIHSSDRIERLTGNPMLLTTLALVKRKMGKLSGFRAELYDEAVKVLLTWRADVDEPIDSREALPQLEYLAYAMCDRGVQQLREDEIISLFEDMRTEYPNVHATHKHTADEFLDLLERRTGILIQAGRVRHLGKQVPVFEFRHLTFQEYLAGLALVERRFPGRDRSHTLADDIAPLAGQTSEPSDTYAPLEVTRDSWREAIRLCVACCSDDDVDEVLSAILKPMEGEDPETTARPRVVLASLCLADEPNVSNDLSQQVLRELAHQVRGRDGNGPVSTGIDKAAMELASLRWGDVLRSVLIDEFQDRPAETRANVGGLYAMAAESTIPMDDSTLQDWLKARAHQISAGSASDAAAAALQVMQFGYRSAFSMLAIDDVAFRSVWKKMTAGRFTNGLLSMLTRSGPEAHAAAWALFWLGHSGAGDGDGAEETIQDQKTARQPWQPSARQVDQIVRFLEQGGLDKAATAVLCAIADRTRDTRVVMPLLSLLDDTDAEVRATSEWALSRLADPSSVEPLIVRMTAEDGSVKASAARILGQVGDRRALQPLIEGLRDDTIDVRSAAAGALGEIGGSEAVEPLVNALRDDERAVRASAARALSRIKTDRALSALRDLASSDDGEARSDAFDALLDLCEDDVDRRLVTRDLDGLYPYIDPPAEIDDARIRNAAERLEIPAGEVRSRYEALARLFPLKLSTLS